ncbi:helix-turn-helix domain-containing protein [Natrinema salaciae]|uniref:Predicted DNA binding protein, contains HTH domain n=1 Tax=Natrinema salaciae TaxID=1186196 RepID=A0A1H9LCF9_9EURY|nr:helix-turn-helix domain-containing protein [Natrinema salaciae]SER09191.1 Predicted DNA binding protein, contains HTH domain [Natrinema salaciae]
MRYAKCIIIPDDEGLHPVDRRIEAHPDISRDLLHNVNLLADETIVTLYQFTGDRDALKSILEDSSRVRKYQLSGVDDVIHAYIHVEADDRLVGLLSMLTKFEFIFDTPLEFTRRGGLCVTMIGDVKSFQKAVPDVPDGIRLKLLKTGSYEPDTDRLYSQLTDRQQEILRTAVDMGYYDVPRAVTHDDIGEELGCTGGTVGGHLRKIESKLLSQVVP